MNILAILVYIRSTMIVIPLFEQCLFLLYGPFISHFIVGTANANGIIFFGAFIVFAGEIILKTAVDIFIMSILLFILTLLFLYFGGYFIYRLACLLSARVNLLEARQDFRQSKFPVRSRCGIISRNPIIYIMYVVPTAKITFMPSSRKGILHRISGSVFGNRIYKGILYLIPRIIHII